MYKVYCDGVAIYDLFSPDLMLLEPTLELELNSPGTFEFTIPLDHPYYDLPQEMLSRVWVTKDDEEIFRGRVIEEEIDWYKRKKVYCEGELAFLNDSIQRPAEYHNMTVRDYFKTLIEEHNSQVEEDKQFEIGYVLVEDTNDSLYRYTNYNSTLTEMKEDLVDDLGGCIRVRNQGGHRYLDYINIEDYGARNDQAIRFGINLLDFTQTMDVSDIATVIIPLGEQLEESPIEALNMRLTIESVNGGSDAIESEEAVKTFGRITKTVIWEDVTLPENLLEKGKKYLSDYQWDNMVLTVTPVDLHDSDPDTESFNLGDELRVISSPHGLDRYFPLSAMTIHLDSLDQNTFTLGTEIKGRTLTGTIQTTVNQVSEVEKEITPTQVILNQAREQATNLITAATHGYVIVEPDEILIMDTDDKSTARKVWRWNMGGLGYSSTGYDGDYGDAAITMDGAINAKYITTGTLTANIIKAGTIEDVFGNNYWDLDKGEFVCKNGIFSGVLQNIDSDNYEIDIESGRIYFIKDNYTIGSMQANDTNNEYGLNLFLNSGYTKTKARYFAIGTNEQPQFIIDFDSSTYSMYNPIGARFFFLGDILIDNSDLYFRWGMGIYWLNLYGNKVKLIYFDQASSSPYNLTLYLGNSSYPTQLYGSTISSNRSITVSSDRKLKEDINDLSEEHEKLFEGLRPRKFRWKSDPEKIHLGFIAQEVNDAMNNAGIDPDEYGLIESHEKDGEEYLSLGYDEIIALLVQEVQGLKEEINELKAKLE